MGDSQTNYGNVVTVNISEGLSFQYSIINKLLITTGEADIDNGAGGFLKLSGATAEADLKAYLSTAGSSAPLAVEAVRVATGQADESGNPIVPEFIYVAGKAIVDYATAADVATLTDFIDGNADYFQEWWGIVPVEYNAKYDLWGATFANKWRRYIFNQTASKVFTIPGTEAESKRMSMYFCDRVGPPIQTLNAAVAGRCVTPEKLTAYSNRTVLGITAYKRSELTEAEVDTLRGNNIMAYLDRYNRPSTNGAIAYDGTTRIDQMYIRDAISYNMSMGLYTWLNTTEYPSIEDRAAIMAVMEQVLNLALDQGLISIVEGQPVQYTTDVPEPNADERSDRWLKRVKFSYLPARAVERITVTGEELLSPITEGGEA